MPEYTLAASVAVVVVIALELFLIRSKVFQKPVYWMSLAIVFAFQVPVDGWLTKLSAPIVMYAPQHMTGARFPWDIPVEDFLFSFAMITFTLALWVRLSGRDEAASARPPSTSARSGLSRDE